MRIAVTGHNGQVVRSLIERARNGTATVIPVGRPELDLTRPESIAGAIRPLRPDIILSVAAYTAVDRAETEPSLARRVNCDGARAVAKTARGLSIPVVHLSTDYVFDGSGTRPWREDDAPAPISVYGRTKLAGERAVAETTPNHAILRTAWVYGPYGSNFVRTMLRLARDRNEVRVVADQTGNPSCSLDIADGLLAVAANLLAAPAPERRGLFHMAGGGETSWADFAEAIFRASAAIGGPTATVRRIATTDYPTAAVRPANSRLDCDRLARIHGVALPRWEDALLPVVARLVAEMHDNVR